MWTFRWLQGRPIGKHLQSVSTLAIRSSRQQPDESEGIVLRAAGEGVTEAGST